MDFQTRLQVVVSLMMALLLTHLPAVVWAEQLPVITTSAVVADLNRSQRLQNVERELQNEELRRGLLERGVSPEEVSQRLSSLTDIELAQLDKQMQEARYGGDILVTILLVVLIVFLVKRI